MWKNVSSKIPHKNNPLLGKNKKQENEIKGHAKVAYDHREDWKFQIHSVKVGVDNANQ